VYERKVVAEIRTRSDRQEAFPALERDQSVRSGSLMRQALRGDIFMGDDFGADREVLMRAKWGSAGGAPGSGWSRLRESF